MRKSKETLWKDVGMTNSDRQLDENKDKNNQFKTLEFVVICIFCNDC